MLWSAYMCVHASWSSQVLLSPRLTDILIAQNAWLLLQLSRVLWPLLVVDAGNLSRLDLWYVTWPSSASKGYSVQHLKKQIMLDDSRQTHTYRTFDALACRREGREPSVLNTFKRERKLNNLIL